MSAKSNQSKRELFCCWYAAIGSVREAAVRAGFTEASALAHGLDILSDPVCRGGSHNSAGRFQTQAV